MLNTEQQSEATAPSPLNPEEVIALAGAGAVVVGTFLPAFHTGFGTVVGWAVLLSFRNERGTPSTPIPTTSDADVNLLSKGDTR